MLKNKILFVLFIFFLILLSFIYLANKQIKHLKRDPQILFNQYYALRKTNKEKASEALKIILKQDPDNTRALQELSQLYLEEKNFQAALPLIQHLQKLEPHNLQYPLQSGQIYYEFGEWQNAFQYLEPLAKQNQNHLIKFQASRVLEKMTSFIPNYNTYAITIAKPSSKMGAAGKPLINTIFLNWFYKLKREDTQAAEQILSVLLFLEPRNPLLNQEMGYLKLQLNDTKAAIPFFLVTYQELSSEQIALQIAYLYYRLGHKAQARYYFLIAAQAKDTKIRTTALKSLSFLQSPAQMENSNPFKMAEAKNPAYQPQNKFTPPQGTTNEALILLDEFYTLKKRDKKLAWQAIQKIAQKYPNNTLALKEAGFLAIELKQSNDAILYFTRVYNLTHEPEIAMQLGYLYDQTPNKYQAYQYFKLATLSSNKELELKAQNALTNLAGLQTKVLPPPYFGELFFTPFTQSRFGLTVRPIIARYGLEFNNDLHSRVYFNFRRTDDNKTNIAGDLPQIYEDNVRIMGVGGSINPLKNFPLVAWLEAGQAYDLVYRNRNRWRGDLRGGLMYYNEFGTKPAYYDTFRISPDYYSTLYGDITYFSRYDNNVIGTFITRQGIRILQYHASIINIYMLGRVFQDTRREFFNNLVEYGPGVGFIPSNRFRIEIRFDYINGTYLPAGGSVNPYGKHYTNKMLQLLYYVRV
ncbi:Uncharacterized enzyme of heme biosynthesis [Legionella busanensis]|uniref:Uncharacterized enzyme of heme biosynthesis n=1 Tax=Legionella busanensis TaxID=190655 RepID=A0A378JJT5_9GAMM|nr:hypothetical protein [Legionella busanensis]STX51434.1 Uncharacterized enzyme of heme biosynthesis [Legionella busanensis]